jgi:hypothetical protein
MKTEKPAKRLAVQQLAAAILVACLTPSAAQDRPKAVVELFTSQGCSSCPVADALLEKLAQRGDVIALSYSVHYWDYIGWKDTLATPENAARQAAYARRKTNGESRVYTPQLVVNGLACSSAQSESKVNDQILKTNTALNAGHISLRARREDGRVIIETSGANAPSAATLWLARVTPKVSVSIQRGENSGRTITYANAVRSIVSIGKWNGADAKFTAALKDDAPGDFHVALLQSDATGAILGALEIGR